MEKSKLTHFDDKGGSRMVNTSHKPRAGIGACRGARK
jgi:hypothetical protein